MFGKRHFRKFLRKESPVQRLFRGNKLTSSRACAPVSLKRIIVVRFGKPVASQRRQFKIVSFTSSSLNGCATRVAHLRLQLMGHQQRPRTGQPLGFVRLSRVFFQKLRRVCVWTWSGPVIFTAGEQRKDRVLSGKFPEKKHVSAENNC